MELYIGNNRIVVLKEVQQLKELPKLIILDLLGNPLCESEDYRSYTVYQLRKLKVLDGVGIEANEQQHAKERFAGRLTPDALIERLGHSFWQHVRDLFLHGHAWAACSACARTVHAHVVHVLCNVHCIPSPRASAPHAHTGA